MTKWIVSVGASALLAFAASPAVMASVVYSDGAFNGTKDAWLVSGGYTVSDSFTLSQNTTVTSVDFLVWDFQSEGTLSTVQWSITSGVLGGTTYGGSQNGVLTGTPEGVNGIGYKLTSENFSTGTLNLGPGTYWLNLDVISPSGSVDLFWDEGDGPSQSYSSNVNGNTQGYITPANFPIAQFPAAAGGCSGPGISGDCSESFDLNGTVAASVAPEPSMYGVLGVVLLGLAWRRKRALSSLGQAADCS
jgi:PEP-CTERM motif